MSVYPVTPPISAEELRARANSSSKKRNSVSFTVNGEVVVPPCPEEGAHYRRRLSSGGSMTGERRSSIDLDGFAEGVGSEHVWFDSREIGHR